jgi:hypothetical protein
MENPHLFKRFGSLAEITENAIITELSAGDFLTRLSIKHETGEYRRAITGSRPSMLESMAAERVISAWLLMKLAAMESLQPGRDRGWATFWLRKKVAAEKGYDAALASLALVRKMLPDIVEVPVAAVGQPIEAVAPKAAQIPAIDAEQPVASGEPVNGFSHEMSVPMFAGVNRISSLLSGRADLVEDAAKTEIPEADNSKLNGFHRLEGLLLPSGS